MQFVEQLILALVGSLLGNVFLTVILLWIMFWSRPVLTHFMAKLKGDKLLLILTEEGRWKLLRGRVREGMFESKNYGDFVAIPDSFRPLAGVPLAIGFCKIGATIPVEFAAKTSVLKRLGIKLKDFVKYKRKSDQPGVEIEEINDVKVPQYRVKEEDRKLVELASDGKYEEEVNIPSVGPTKVIGFILNVKDTFEYMLLHLNPINLRARINARVQAELAARQRGDVLRTAFAVFMVVIGIAFAIIMLSMFAPGTTEHAVQSVKQSVPISISSP